jgi:60 kDa SS-A/Ro ribonucleoprotein
MAKAYKTVATRKKTSVSNAPEVTPQSQPLPGQVPNSAGGYSFEINDWTRLARFLVLGSEGGTYYISEKKLTKANADVVQRCLSADGKRTVDTIVEISEAGRAPKNDAALFALAVAASDANPATRAYALDNLYKVARIGTHLFQFVSYVKEFRGWGRGLRTAVGDWYNKRGSDDLEYQLIKYQRREGWSNADLLRKSHPVPRTEGHAKLFKFAVDGEYRARSGVIYGYMKAQKAKSAEEVAALVREYNLPREALPTQFLSDVVVWEALLEKMPMTALIRNLGNMSKVGLLVPMSKASKLVVERLMNSVLIEKARVHPIQVLLAAKTYESGRGFRGAGAWNAVPQVVDALDAAYYLSFGNVVSTNKRFYLGLDISGSMFGNEINGTSIDAATASAAMAMVTLRAEENYYLAGFTHQMERISGLTAKSTLSQVFSKMREMSQRMRGTDCALPMLDAAKLKIPVDVFAVYTDSETWFGDVHPTNALKMYRDKTGIPAKLVVVGMCSNGFTIADSSDAGQLDVVGFDTATPNVIAGFASGEF